MKKNTEQAPKFSPPTKNFRSRKVWFFLSGILIFCLAGLGLFSQWKINKTAAVLAQQKEAIIGSNNLVRLSSDKKREGSPADFGGITEKNLGKGPQHETTANGTLRLFTSVMGLDDKFGTLVIEYTPQVLAKE